MYHTEQEKFWAGAFGDEYAGRNRLDQVLPGNLALFARIFRHRAPGRSVLEFGANIGGNLCALRTLFPEMACSAIEINASAVEILRRQELGGEIFAESILEFEPRREYDLTLSKGVLIHQNPEQLPAVYDRLYRAARRYICLVEYYNPSPVEVTYRGNAGVLFKRDFAGEMLDRYPDLTLADYGFSYHRDPNFPQDDLNWFLLQKP